MFRAGAVAADWSIGFPKELKHPGGLLYRINGEKQWF